MSKPLKTKDYEVISADEHKRREAQKKFAKSFFEQAKPMKNFYEQLDEKYLKKD